VLRAANSAVALKHITYAGARCPCTALLGQRVRRLHARNVTTRSITA